MSPIHRARPFAIYIGLIVTALEKEGAVRGCRPPHKRITRRRLPEEARDEHMVRPLVKVCRPTHRLKGAVALIEWCRHEAAHDAPVEVKLLRHAHRVGEVLEDEHEGEVEHRLEDHRVGKIHHPVEGRERLAVASRAAW